MSRGMCVLGGVSNFLQNSTFKIYSFSLFQIFLILVLCLLQEIFFQAYATLFEKCPCFIILRQIWNNMSLLEAISTKR